MEYQTLLKRLLVGDIEGEATVPEHRESLISHVFLFPTKAYKLYKNASEEFAFLNTVRERRVFIERDFEWNRSMSPTVYQALTEIDGELLIVMRRVPDEDLLSELVAKRALTLSDAATIGRELGETLAKIPLQPLPGYVAKLEQRLDALQKRIEYLTGVVSKEEWAKYVEILRTTLSTHASDFEQIGQAGIANVGDLNGDNLAYAKHLLLLDTYIPKPEWIHDHVAPLYRVGLTFEALGSRELSDAYMTNVKKVLPHLFSARFDSFWSLYAALIEISYRSMLKKQNSAHKGAEEYLALVRNQFLS